MKVGPDFAPPPQSLPEQWSEADLRHAFRGEAPSAEWWTQFHDPALSALILRARRESPTVETVLLRVAQARALYGQALGQLFPQQQALTGEYEWSHPSRRSPDAAQPGEPSGPSSVQEINVGMQMSWELDFWGKYRRGAEAAHDTLMAAQAAHELALVTLSADVAQQYLNYRTLQERIRIAEKNNRAQQEAVRLTEVRFRHGAVSERDYAQALAQQKSTEADLPALRGQLKVARNALCVLLGQAPGPLAELEGSGIPRVDGTIAVGIPSDVIRRRPDVRRAELLAASQCAQIGVRKADLFPSFSLGGFIGFQGSNVGAFTLGQTWDHGFTANAGPSALFPFLNYGRLLNAVRAGRRFPTGADVVPADRAYGAGRGGKRHDVPTPRSGASCRAGTGPGRGGSRGPAHAPAISGRKRGLYQRRSGPVLPVRTGKRRGRNYGRNGPADRAAVPRARRRLETGSRASPANGGGHEAAYGLGRPA